MITIKIAGLDELIRICGQDFGPTFRAILHGVGELVRDEMAQNPGPVHKPIVWASAKQRRYVMALVREHGPWQRERGRSERLIAGWTVKDLDNYHVKVGTHATYGPWVQSADDQQPMHAATGWMTDEKAINAVAHSGDAERIAGQAIEHALSGR